MISRGVNLTQEECRYLDDMAQLTGRSSAAVLRTAVRNLWALTSKMERVDGTHKAIDVLGAFIDIDQSFNEGYNAPNGGRTSS